MKVHVTCGRGTEPFVRKELYDKLHCTVTSVEDGKVFFTLADLPGADRASESCQKQMFNLKTVERIFATVVHFPTSDIKGNGKVKFLHALKDRVLSRPSLTEAANSALTLMLMQKQHTGQGTQSDDPKSDQPFSTGALHESPVETQQESAVEGGMHSTPQNGSSDDCTRDAQHKHPVCQTTGDGAGDSHCGEHGKYLFTQISKKDCQSGERVLQARRFSKKDCQSGKRVLQASSNCCEGVPTSQTRSTISRCNAKTDCQGAGLLNACKDDCLAGPPMKSRRRDSMQTAVCIDGEDIEERAEESGVRRATEQQRPLSDAQNEEAALSFRFSVKCGGWCKKWLQPQRLARELGIRLTVMTGWAVNLHSPDIEICLHVNDDFVTAGIPLTRLPLSKRDYIQDAGLRSTVSWIMVQQADIQPGHCVLDPMCGKATILMEAAKEHPQVTGFLGCDLDPRQLQAADSNVKHAQLCQSVQLLQADALNLPLRAGSVDRIVCDAPFGNKFMAGSGSLSQFYEHLMLEMLRLLTPDGLAVLLTSQELQPVVQENCQAAADCDAPEPGDGTPAAHQNHADPGRLQTPMPLPDPAVSVTRESAAQGIQEWEIPQEIHTLTPPCLQAVCEADMAHVTEPSPIGDPKLRTVEEQPSHRDRHSDCDSSHRETALQSSSCAGVVSTDSVSAARTEDSRFSLLSTHYMKLGETHAYMLVLKKSVYSGNVVNASC